MEMKQQQQHNPKSSYKLRRRGDSWSELPSDLLNSVVERLGFADSRRVGSVCSSWHSAAKRCVAKKQIPWLILLPDEDEEIETHWCKLFNPEENGKLYRMRADVFEFAKSYCLATCGNWLLMVDHGSVLYMLNLFTHERIVLPPVESQLGTTKLERNSEGWFCISNGNYQPQHCPSKLRGINTIMRSPVFWIDEQTKEYVVVWGLGEWCLVYSKKGDTFWSQIQTPRGYSTDFSRARSEMVYKDDKLCYLLLNRRTGGCIKIFDFSTEIPQETFHCGLAADPSPINRLTSPRDPWRIWRIRRTKLVVTVTGDVLKVEQWVKTEQRVQHWSFRVYKAGFLNKYDEKVDSLGDEAMLFDLGITVLANDDFVGFKRNSIFFNDICHEKNTTQICVFNLETQEMEEPLHMFVCSSEQQLARARWFLPSSFKQT
ncbi:PREDICTED: probable F-box protein At4g22165 [Camelina sativa]|uniref:Probable F-box protein At4g22165 n=1 Tax=Camelina sativa TaxID=90675 RepID=A0ABM0V4I7_CAMSA|nr:PREDICTED: probable F-box protein At4g22165 [Camelina sativa]